MIEVKRYTPELNLQWDDAVTQSKNGIFLFYRDYMDYHRDRFLDHSLLVYRKNKVVAVFPANQNGAEIISHGGLTFGSLVMSPDLKAVEALEAISAIIEYYGIQLVSRIIYKAVPYIFHSYPAQEDLYALQRIGAHIFRRDLSSVVNIKEAIRFSESKRQAVNKCQNIGITVQENVDFITYWPLLTEVLSKFGTAPVHSLDEIRTLKARFPENIKLFEATLDGQLLAGTVIYDFGKTIHTQYMANSQEGRKLGALDYINHVLISDIYRKKDYYSFGISTEEAGMKLNEGLVQQKEMMGGRGIALDFYEIKL